MIEEQKYEIQEEETKEEKAVRIYPPPFDLKAISDCTVLGDLYEGCRFTLADDPENRVFVVLNTGSIQYICKNTKTGDLAFLSQTRIVNA